MKIFLKILPIFLLTLFVASRCNEGDQTVPDNTKEVIVDTDMGLDDWMAILFLLRHDDIIVKGITVNCTGLAYCPQGAQNVTKLLSLVVDDKPQYANLPIYYGDVPSDTLNYQYPESLRQEVSNFQVKGFENLPSVGTYQYGAAEFIENILVKAAQEKKQLHFISIGPSTNFAKAIKIANTNNRVERFRQGLAMYYKGGGAFGAIKEGQISNNNIEGNIHIPDLYPSNNRQAEWNIYPDAISEELLFENGIPRTFIPLNLTKDIALTEESWRYIDENAKSPSAKFVAATVYMMGDRENWDDLQYWDPVVVYASLYPHKVQTSFSNISLCVDTSGDKEFQGTTYVDLDKQCDNINAKIGVSNIYYELNNTKDFYSTFLEVLN